MIHWIVWAFVLIAQAASSTWASRARNTGSVAYHSIAAVFSHGVWFISNLFMGFEVIKLAREGSIDHAVFLGVFYTTFCVIGSTLAHHVSQKYFEQGKRKVGA
jgi:hypothetical protein